MKKERKDIRITFRITEKEAKRLNQILKHTPEGKTPSEYFRKILNADYELSLKQERTLIYDSKAGKIFIKKILRDPIDGQIIKNRSSKFPLFDLRTKKLSGWLGLAKLQPNTIKTMPKQNPKEILKKMKTAIDSLSQELGENVKCKIRVE